MATVTRRPARRNPLLRLLSFEDRVVPTVYTVDLPSDTGAGSGLFGDLRYCLTEANAAATNDEIVFSSGLPSATITLSSALPAISGSQGSLKIDGSGIAGMTISGGNNVRVLEIASGGVVTASDLSFVFGQATDGGGIYSNAASLSMTRCIISDNVAGQDGGGLYVAAGATTLTDCTITDNTAGRDGGGLYVGSGTATLKGSSTSADFRIALNDAGRDGGGIAVLGGSLFVTNAQIDSGNSAPVGRGAGIFSQTLTSVTDTSFQSAGAMFGGGIAVVGSSGSLTANNCSFLASSMSGALPFATDGGGIYLNNVSTSVKSSIVNDCLFLETHVERNGGGIAIVGSGLVEIVDASFNSAESADGSGGCVYVGDFSGTASDVLLLRAKMDGNDGLEGKFGAGVGIVNLSASVRILECSIGIAHAGAETARGGGIDITGVTAKAGSVTIGQRTKIFQCVASIGGGIAVFQTNAVVSIADSTITMNKADDGTGPFLGAGIYIEEAASVTIANCEISSNTATGSGGGIYVVNSTTTVSIVECTIDSNVAADSGGGLYIDASPNVSIAGSTISRNEATKLNGGGLYFPDGGNNKIVNCTISSNTADLGAGGGVYYQATASSNLPAIFNSTITQNTAVTGGGIELNGFVSSADTITLISSIVAENFAAGDGNDINAVGNVGGPAKVLAPTGLIGIDDDGDFMFDGTAPISGKTGMAKSPELEGLDFNGGRTETHAFKAGASIAIDKGSNPQSLVGDQRGNDFVRAYSTSPPPTADVGAYERQEATSEVDSVVVNNGAVQRSMVLSIRVTFNHGVGLPALPASAFVLARQSDGALPGLNATVDNTGPGTVVTITFFDSGFGGVDVPSKSLSDGRYTLTVISGTSGVPDLDGDGDGTPGDDYVLVGNTTSAPKLFRFFGDVDGDGDVDITDFNAFRAAFGAGPSDFDWEIDGDTDNSDFMRFRANFGTTLP